MNCSFPYKKNSCSNISLNTDSQFCIFISRTYTITVRRNGSDTLELQESQTVYVCIQSLIQYYFEKS